MVAKRFEAYCHRNGFSAKPRLPYGAMRTFVVHHLDCSARGGRFPTQHVRKWHRHWLAETSGGNAIAAQGPKSLLKSWARKPLHCRSRVGGAGRPFQAPLVRQALYEWWSSIRYSIDWKALVASRRSRGRKKNLARFPRKVLRMKAIELLECHAHAALLSGARVRSFVPDAHWFARWEEEYGLSMRRANRKYQVPRSVLKERLEICWVDLSRVRFLTQSVFN